MRRSRKLRRSSREGPSVVRLRLAPSGAAFLTSLRSPLPKRCTALCMPPRPRPKREPDSYPVLLSSERRVRYAVRGSEHASYHRCGRMLAHAGYVLKSSDSPCRCRVWPLASGRSHRPASGRTQAGNRCSSSHLAHMLRMLNNSIARAAIQDALPQTMISVAAYARVEVACTLLAARLLPLKASWPTSTRPTSSPNPSLPHTSPAPKRGQVAKFSLTCFLRVHTPSTHTSRRGSPDKPVRQSSATATLRHLHNTSHIRQDTPCTSRASPMCLAKPHCHSGIDRVQGLAPR